MADKKSLQTIAAAVTLALTSGAALAAVLPAGTKLAAKQELVRSTVPSRSRWTRWWWKACRPTSSLMTCSKA